MITLSDSGSLGLGHPLTPGALSFQYMPKLRMRIAGRGADSLALARLATASGIHIELQLGDDAEAQDAQLLGIEKVTLLTLPSTLPKLDDDPWTAFLLAFHDIDWEENLLAQALEGSAFYIGAVGLIPSMRDASMLAVSVLAEIVAAYQLKVRLPFIST